VTPIAKNTSRVPNSLPTSIEVKVYPNPTTSQFNVLVKSTGTEESVIRVLDLTGRFIKSVKVSSNSNVNLGSDLKAGSYMLEVRQGKEVNTVRVMKF
jgi:myo-inositol-hexaphosphate 3-phosphohydrolase